MDYIIDAKGKRLGRLASEIAMILQGKKRSNFEGRLAGEDRVIVKNADQIVVSGEKSRQKVYYRHTGPLGHLKVKKYEDILKRRPAWILYHAVKLMLPRNRLRAQRLKRLIFE